MVQLLNDHFLVYLLLYLIYIHLIDYFQFEQELLWFANLENYIHLLNYLLMKDYLLKKKSFLNKN